MFIFIWVQAQNDKHFHLYSVYQHSNVTQSFQQTVSSYCGDIYLSLQRWSAHTNTGALGQLTLLALPLHMGTFKRTNPQSPPLWFFCLRWDPVETKPCHVSVVIWASNGTTFVWHFCKMTGFVSWHVLENSLVFVLHMEIWRRNVTCHSPDRDETQEKCISSSKSTSLN